MASPAACREGCCSGSPGAVGPPAPTAFTPLTQHRTGRPGSADTALGDAGRGARPRWRHYTAVCLASRGGALGRCTAATHALEPRKSTLWQGCVGTHARPFAPKAGCMSAGRGSDGDRPRSKAGGWGWGPPGGGGHSSALHAQQRWRPALTACRGLYDVPGGRQLKFVHWFHPLSCAAAPVAGAVLQRAGLALECAGNTACGPPCSWAPSLQGLCWAIAHPHTHISAPFYTLCPQFLARAQRSTQQGRPHTASPQRDLGQPWSYRGHSLWTWNLT